MSSIPIGTFVLLASTRASGAKLVPALGRYARALVLPSMDGAPEDCIGVITTLANTTRLASHVDYAGFRVSARGARRLETDRDLNAFASYCVARWCCGNAKLAEAISRLDLTPKQVSLLALCCTDLSRLAICKILDVSPNTLKTRIRLLPGPLGKSRIGELVDDLLQSVGQSTRLPAQGAGLTSRLALPPRKKRVFPACERYREAIERFSHAHPEWGTLTLSQVRLRGTLVTFASRNGLTTLGELMGHETLSWSPVVREAILQALQELEASGPVSRLASCRSVQEMVAELPPALWSAPVGDLPVLARLHSFALRHGLLSLGEVLSHPALSCGKKTLEHTRGVLVNLMERPDDILKPYDLARTRSITQAFEKRLKVLTAKERDVIEARAGLKGRAEILRDIAERNGQSRERIRQVEEAGLVKLSSQGFAAAIEARLHELWQGRVVAHDDASVGWLRGGQGRDHVARYVLHHFVSEERRVHFVSVQGRMYLMPMSQTSFEDEVRKAKQRLAKLTYPASRSEVLAAIEQHGQHPTLGPVLLQSVHESLLWAPGERRAFAFGAGHRGCVLAVLSASDKPLSITHLSEHLGRGAIPKEAIYFARGVLGLEQHFLDFAAHQRALTPWCLRRLKQAPERQWHTRDLLRLLRQSRIAVPDWMTHWHLTALLRRSHALRYLGRHCFVLASSSATERLMYRDLVLETLASGEHPLTTEEIATALAPRRSIEPHAMRKVLDSPPFVKQSDGRWTVAPSGQRARRRSGTR